MSKIRSKYVQLDDQFIFTGDIQVPTPDANEKAANKAYVDSKTFSPSQVNYTTNSSLSSNNTGKMITNSGAVTTVSLTLPAATPTLVYEGLNLENQQFNFITSGEDEFRYGVFTGTTLTIDQHTSIKFGSYKSGIWHILNIGGGYNLS